MLAASTPPSCDIPTLIPIKRGDTLTFGRNKDADVFLDSTKSVARGHRQWENRIQECDQMTTTVRSDSAHPFVLSGHGHGRRNGEER